MKRASRQDVKPLHEIIKEKAQLVTAIASLVAAFSSLSVGYLSIGSAKRDDVQSAKQEIVGELKQRVDLLDARINYHADWICQENVGHPHPSFPCYKMTWNSPPKGKPVRTTNVPYPGN